MKIPKTELIKEFKAFAFKGNMIDLAVGVVIGAAFGKVIDALVKSVIMPALSYLPLGDEGYKGWKLGKLEVGLFIGEIVSFLLIAAVIFIIIVKLLGTFMKKAPPPPVKQCPRCISDVPIAATRCKFCTSDLVKA